MGVFEVDEVHSPKHTSSEDSIHVRVKSVKTSPNGGRKNKRKSLEPRRFNLEHSDLKRRRLNSTGSEDRSPQNPALSRTPSPTFKSPVHQDREPTQSISPQHLAPKKRFKFDALREIKRLEEKGGTGEATQTSADPFRPWGEAQESSPPTPAVLPQVSSCIPFLLQGFRQGEVPLSLIPGYAGCPLLLPIHQPVQEEPLSLVKEKKPELEAKDDKSSIQLLKSPKKGQTESFTIKTEELESPEKDSLVLDDKAKQRNYKNLTRARRVEANARERQRVHTITAAFDTLQAAIPTSEENIKLSKLSVIKIATAYIMALSRMAGHDYSEDQSAPPVQAVLQHCRETIETESKIKKRA